MHGCTDAVKIIVAQTEENVESQYVQSVNVVLVPSIFDICHISKCFTIYPTINL